MGGGRTARAALSAGLILAGTAAAAVPQEVEDAVMEFALEFHESFAANRKLLDDAYEGRDENLEPKFVGDFHRGLFYLWGSGDEWLPEDVDPYDLLHRIHTVRKKLGYRDALYANDFLWCANQLKSRGEFGPAERLYRAALEELDPDDPYLARIHMLLAELLRHRGRFVTAGDGLEVAGRLLAALDDSDQKTADRIFLLSQRGKIYNDIGMPDLAAPYYEEEHALADAYARREIPGEDFRDRRDRVSYWAEAILDRMNLCHARDTWVELERLWVDTKEDPLYEWIPDRVRWALDVRLAGGLAEAEEIGPGATEGLRLHHPRAGIERLEECLAEDLPFDERRLALTWLITSHLDHGEHDTARERLVELDGLLGDRRDHWVEPSVFAVELALAEGAPEGRLRELEVRLRSAFDHVLSEWQNTELRGGGVAMFHYPERLQIIGSLVRLSLEIEGPDTGAESALEHIVRAQRLGTVSRTLGLEAPTLDEVRETLTAPGRGLLCYQPGVRGSYVFAIDERGVEVFDLERLYELDQARRRLMEAIGFALRRNDPRRAEALERARVEATRLFLPEAVRRHIEPWSSVVFVGVDSLGYLPFEYLLLDEGRELGLATATGYLPSLPVGVFLAHERPAPVPAGAGSPGFTLFGAPDPGPTSLAVFRDVAAIEMTERAVSLLKRAYEGREVRPYVGPDATLERLRAGGGGATFPAQHLLAHGVPNPIAELGRGLLLHGGTTESGVLWPDDVAGLDVSPLVVLTACGLWQAPLRRGDDGRGHLGGAFLLAGARSVVLSYTALQFRPSVELMAAFHDGLARRGESPEVALLSARREVVENPGGDVHPVHAFLVHSLGLGDSRLFVPTERSNLAWWIAGTALVVAGSAYGMRRARRRAA